ncbi:MFS transporter [Streptomyces sp. P38-E01]|uniref:MFS transporter n=1 Tax=Streptomyces tardus TaxID=2780544 RepID=A0A949JBQ1_9ACTN|nr:MFS transporter [Streptomyces tardus]MBU7597107.1 MFS transporter [Streptomyces tardus]
MSSTLAAPDPEADSRPRLWSPARNRNFRLLWAGQSLSLLGDGFSVIAFSWITLTLTGSTLALGYVLAFQAVPRALFTLVGGTLGDTWSTRTLMAVSSFARAALMAAVGLIGLADGLTVWMLCAAAAAFGTVDAFFHPARVAILPSVVDEKTLPPANALLSAGARTAAVIGPGIGGTVIAFTGAPAAFLVDAVCFAVCGWCVLAIRPRQRNAQDGSADTSSAAVSGPDSGSESGPDSGTGSASGSPDSGAGDRTSGGDEKTLAGESPDARGSVEEKAVAEKADGGKTGAEQQPDPGPAAQLSLGARIREGVVYTWRDPRLRTIVALDTAINFCYSGPFVVGFATLANEVLSGGSATLGLLNGALAGGALLGALAGGAVGGRLRVGLLVAALAGWLAMGMTVLGLVDSTVAVLAVVLTMGFGIGFQGVYGISWIQRNIPQNVLSRVISVDMVLGYAVAPVSLIVCGALAGRSPTLLFSFVGVILLLTGLAVLSSRSVREMR